MILYFNADEGLTKEVDKIVRSKNKDYTSVFIDWIPTKKAVSQKKASNLLSQTDILEKYVKTLPIVIFDRYRSITTEEFSWLKKFKVTFFEPAILTRNGFKYLPNWIKIKELDDIKLNESKRSVNIGYIGVLSDRSKSFDKYYVKTKINNPDIKMCYFTQDVNKDKESEYQALDITRYQDLSFSDMEFSVIIGNANDYVVGHLDQYYIKALENNCIPVLPRENRYYSALPFNISNTTWYDAYVNMYDRTYVGFIHDIYNSIKKYYPEMNVKYTAEIIQRYLEEK
jgi:hypothetical protein